MLQGKPSVRDEAVTMDAIKSILTDFESEVTEMPTPKRKPVVAPDQDMPELAPVAVVEAKVAKARFTTIPSEEITNALVRPLSATMAPRRDNDGTMPLRSDPATAGSKAPSNTIMGFLAKLKIPTFGLPQFLSGQKRTADTVPTAKSDTTAYSKTLFTPARISLVAAALAIVMFPATVFLLIVLAAFLVGCTVVLMGSDAVWAKLRAGIEWYCRRNPERRDEVYDRLDDIAVAWDNFLDRFPEGSVDGLYMPDFANLEELERQHEATVSDRLERMHQQV